MARKGLREVGDQVVRILKTDVKAKEGTAIFSLD
jgi:hypothetical protein